MRAVAAVVAVLATGCAATVTCPVLPGADARAVFLLDHGRHSSIVVEAAPGRLHQYSYGDRRWYAEEDTGLVQGFNALFRDTPAVLRRRAWRADATLDDAARGSAWVVVRAFALRAPGARVDALVAELDAIYDASPDDPRPEFAPHPRAYTGGHNSNHMVAEWLGDLGCDTAGNPALSSWRVTTSTR